MMYSVFEIDGRGQRRTIRDNVRDLRTALGILEKRLDQLAKRGVYDHDVKIWRCAIT